MKKYMVFSCIVFISSFAFAQDIIVSISAKIAQQQTSLDSISFENLTNGTDTTYSNLPEFESYNINLTNYNLVEVTELFFKKRENVFSMVKCVPGQLMLKYEGINPTEFYLNILNINGQIVYQSGKQKIDRLKSLQVNIQSQGFFVIKIESEFGIQAFKTLGIDKGNSFGLHFSSEIFRASNLKSNVSITSDSFHFALGDSVRISIYKNNYSTLNRTIKIEESTAIEFELIPEIIKDTFVDSRDGKSYKTVVIDGIVWMAENLAYIPGVFPPTSESIADPRYYIYDFDGTELSLAKQTDNYKIYGVLYNWPAALEACPGGWRLPSDDEWESLAKFISDLYGPYDKMSDDWYDVGKHLKATSGWYNNGNGIDDLGFSGLPGGRRTSDGAFRYIGDYGQFWSSTSCSAPYPNLAWLRELRYERNNFNREGYSKELGFCVRCIKNK